MTLKEKFGKVEVNIEEGLYGIVYLNDIEAENCEKIADEFAIGFAEWLSYRYKYLDNKGWFATTYHLEMGISKTSEELLKMYKIENEL
jgi:hypothetical protein